MKSSTSLVAVHTKCEASASKVQYGQKLAVFHGPMSHGALLLLQERSIGDPNHTRSVKNVYIGQPITRNEMQNKYKLLSDVHCSEEEWTRAFIIVATNEERCSLMHTHEKAQKGANAVEAAAFINNQNAEEPSNGNSTLSNWVEKSTAHQVCVPKVATGSIAALSELEQLAIRQQQVHYYGRACRRSIGYRKNSCRLGYKDDNTFGGWQVVTHKSEGRTLSRTIVAPFYRPAVGCVYTVAKFNVAFSRVTTAEHMQAEGFNKDSFVHIEECSNQAPWHLARIHHLGCGMKNTFDRPFGCPSTILYCDLSQLGPVSASATLAQVVMDVYADDTPVGDNSIHAKVAVDATVHDKRLIGGGEETELDTVVA